MTFSDATTVYEIEIKGITYCFRYFDPTTRDGGKSFDGVATAWKKGNEGYFTVPFHVKADDVDKVYFKIIEGIEKHLSE